eukprot:TRINITY_DN4954_c0_g1_i1.p1 TRINITY_DN4954_c0_g1~~TRINITY_DN4954_c0_g1_i1.p1  ORF type:complete len:958 (+),score=225.91 TRINITY_DN4954_c0_g1_i1:140-3013(+)
MFHLAREIDVNAQELSVGICAVLSSIRTENVFFIHGAPISPLPQEDQFWLMGHVIQWIQSPESRSWSSIHEFERVLANGSDFLPSVVIPLLHDLNQVDDLAEVFDLFESILHRQYIQQRSIFGIFLRKLLLRWQSGEFDFGVSLLNEVKRFVEEDPWRSPIAPRKTLSHIRSTVRYFMSLIEKQSMGVEDWERLDLFLQDFQRSYGQWTGTESHRRFEDFPEIFFLFFLKSVEKDRDFERAFDNLYRYFDYCASAIDRDVLKALGVSEEEHVHADDMELQRERRRHDRLEIMAVLQLGTLHYRFGHWKAAEGAMMEALQVAFEKGVQEGVRHAVLWLAKILMLQRSRLRSSLMEPPAFVEEHLDRLRRRRKHHAPTLPHRITPPVRLSSRSAGSIFSAPLDPDRALFLCQRMSPDNAETNLLVAESMLLCPADHEVHPLHVLDSLQSAVLLAGKVPISLMSQNIFKSPQDVQHDTEIDSDKNAFSLTEAMEEYQSRRLEEKMLMGDEKLIRSCAFRSFGMHELAFFYSKSAYMGCVERLHGMGTSLADTIRKDDRHNLIGVGMSGMHEIHAIRSERENDGEVMETSCRSDDRCDERERCEQQRTRAMALLQMAEIHLDHGDYGLCRSRLEMGLNGLHLNKNFFSSFMLFGAILLVQRVMIHQMRLRVAESLVGQMRELAYHDATSHTVVIETGLVQAEVLLCKGDYSACVNHLQRVLEDIRASRLTRFFPKAQRLLADARLRAGCPTVALQEIKVAVRFSQKYHLMEEYYRGCILTADILVRIGDPERANGILNSILSGVMGPLGMFEVSGSLELALAKCLIAKGPSNLHGACRLLHLAQSKFEKVGYLEGLMRVHHLLARAYDMLANIARRDEHVRLYEEIGKTIAKNQEDDSYLTVEWDDFPFHLVRSEIPASSCASETDVVVGVDDGVSMQLDEPAEWAGDDSPGNLRRWVDEF